MADTQTAIEIKGSKIASVPATQKDTKRGPQTYREFTVGDVFANFWGEPEPDKKYQFVYEPNASGRGGLMKCINGEKRPVAALDVDITKLKTVAVVPPKPAALLALLTKGKKAPAKAEVDADEDED